MAAVLAGNSFRFEQSMIVKDGRSIRFACEATSLQGHSGYVLLTAMVVTAPESESESESPAAQPELASTIAVEAWDGHTERSDSPVPTVTSPMTRTSRRHDVDMHGDAGSAAVRSCSVDDRTGAPYDSESNRASRSPSDAASESDASTDIDAASDVDVARLDAWLEADVAAGFCSEELDWVRGDWLGDAVEAVPAEC